MAPEVLTFNLAVNYWDAPSTRRIKRRLGYPGIEAHQRLLAFARTDRPTGILYGLDEHDLADIARWDGDARELIDVFTDLELLDRHEGGGYEIHAWARWNHWASLAPKREAIARKAAEKRWLRERSRKKAPSESDAQSNPQGIASSSAYTHTLPLRETPVPGKIPEGPAARNNGQSEASDGLPSEAERGRRRRLPLGTANGRVDARDPQEML